MGDSLFDIFGDRILNRRLNNVRQPLSNAENMGKMAAKQVQGPVKQLQGPIKPNEPMKKGEVKKSFLSNKGTALLNTPVRTPFTPCKVNVGSLIYADICPKNQDVFDFNEVDFTKPSYLCDNYHSDALDFLPMEECELLSSTPPRSPSPVVMRHEMSFSSDNELDWDVSSNDEIVVDDLGLPDIF